MKYLFVLLGWLLSFPLWAQVQLGTNAIHNNSGWSVALSANGNTIAIGVPTNSPSGQVRVYRLINGDWSQLGQEIDGEALGDQSGYAVALSVDGNTVAIGAPYNDGTTGNKGDNRGHVRIYHWTGNNWIQIGTDLDGETVFDNSGTSVDLSSDGATVAIGAPYNGGATGNIGDARGHVRVYHWSGSSWAQLGADLDGETTIDNSGGSVSLSADGKTVAIGAVGDDGTTGNLNDNRGHVRIYYWTGSNWSQLGTDIDGTEAGDFSGFSVDVSADGKTVAIGAISNDGSSGNRNDNRGLVRVYYWSGSSWTQRGVDLYGETTGDLFGFSVSLSADGNMVAIGAPFSDGPTGADLGRVKVYWLSCGSWIQRGEALDGETAGDQSGYSVALSADGNTIAIGGHVRIFRFTEAVQAPAFCLQASGVLGLPTCQVRLLGQATGNVFIFTGPGGYIFSNVYRQEGTYSVFAEGIRQPGVYQLRVLSEVSEVTTTVTVGGTACP